jgi:predicted DNA-binding protein with PD1-like motif
MVGMLGSPSDISGGLKEWRVKVYPSEDGKAAFVRLERGTDLLASLNEGAAELGVEAGTVQVIGAVQELVLGYFNQQKKEYEPHHFTGGFEIASGLGNVSLKDGKPFVHMHLVCAGKDASTIGGHLMEGTAVYLGEAYFRQLGGPAPAREQDDDIGLPAWG